MRQCSKNGSARKLSVVRELSQSSEGTGPRGRTKTKGGAGRNRFRARACAHRHPGPVQSPKKLEWIEVQQCGKPVRAGRRKQHAGQRMWKPNNRPINLQQTNRSWLL